MIISNQNMEHNYTSKIQILQNKVFVTTLMAIIVHTYLTIFPMTVFAGPSRVHIPVIINYYNNCGLSKGSTKVKEAIKKANKILKDNKAEMMLWVVKEIDPATAGDDGNDGNFSPANDYKEMRDINKAGKDEIEKTDNETGLKISFVQDCNTEKSNWGAWNFPGEPVIVLEDYSAEQTARSIIHELAHAFGNTGHSTGANDVTNASGSGNNIPADHLKKMKENRKQMCKCSKQMDEEHPGVRKRAQRGRKTDARGDQNSPAYLDLCTTRLYSVDGENEIDGFLSIDNIFEGLVNVNYVLTFDSDNNDATGFMHGPFSGREYSVELHVTGDAGNYTISGLVCDLSDNSTVALPENPSIETSEIHDAPLSAFHQFLFKVPKDYLGLDIDFVQGSSPNEIPVGVFVEESSAICDTASFEFRMDQWLRDPLLQTFGNGVPEPGQSHPFYLEGLEGGDEFSLYVDQELVLSAYLTEEGTYEGSFIFPENMSNLEAHFLTAQDSTGEFAYSMTCPKPHPHMDISTLSHDFGKEKIGKSSPPYNIAISNTGNEDLTVSDIILSDNTNFALDLNAGSNPCGDTVSIITSDCNCTLAVIFEPSSRGSKTTILTVHSDDPENPSIVVSLSGKGIKSTSSLNYGGWLPSYIFNQEPLPANYDYQRTLDYFSSYYSYYFLFLDSSFSFYFSSPSYLDYSDYSYYYSYPYLNLWFFDYSGNLSVNHFNWN